MRRRGSSRSHWSSAWSPALPSSRRSSTCSIRPTASPAPRAAPRRTPLPAPQAGLISALAQGVIQNNVDWSLIKTGIGIGVVLIFVDIVLRRVKPGAHLSPLAVGLGIYLPTQSTLMVVVGAVAG